MKYRCKHVIEAMRWDGENSNSLFAWFATKSGTSPSHGQNGSCLVFGDDFGDFEIEPGEWLVWSSGEFLVMDNEQFRETYEPVT